MDTDKSKEKNKVYSPDVMMKKVLEGERKRKSILKNYGIGKYNRL